MATINIRNDRTQQLKIEDFDDRYIIHRGASIINDQEAILAANTYTGNHIIVHGLVRGDVAVLMDADRSTVELSETGRIRGEDGIDVVDFFTLMNRGSIITNDDAVEAGDRAKLDNFGLIDGAEAVYFENGTLRNHGSGKIFATDIAVGTNASGNETATIINDGLIRSDLTAIAGNSGRDVIINRGTIEGTVDLGGGDDLFDARGGTYVGTLIGGEGDDTYITDDSAFFAAEIDGEGTDAVKATVNFTLGNAMENLVLLGDKNRIGKGNALLNDLDGNSGDNKLYGFAGNDFLDGRAGNDVLFGGSEVGIEDTFIFGMKYDNDRIGDFEDNVDKLSLSKLTAVDDFDDLFDNHTRNNADGDLVIFTSKTNTLTISGMSRADLDSTDVFFD